MKKLLMGVAIATMAVAAEAATVTWGAVNLYKADGITKYSSAVELLVVTKGGSLSDASLLESYTASATGAVASHTYDWTSAVDGSSYDFYYRLTDEDKYLVSSKITCVASSVGAMTVAFGNQKSYTTDAGNWQSVPEPTSGLLVLLGVAGLALKRKRA